MMENKRHRSTPYITCHITTCTSYHIYDRNRPAQLYDFARSVTVKIKLPFHRTNASMYFDSFDLIIKHKKYSPYYIKSALCPCEKDIDFYQRSLYLL